MDRLEGWEIDALESLVRQYEWSAHDYYSKAYDIEMDSDDAKILEKAIKIIKAIPSEEPKTGHWITKIKSDLRGDMWPTNPKCSKCGGEPYYSNTIYDYKFCPYCGARMVEPQESEDKE